MLSGSGPPRGPRCAIMADGAMANQSRGDVDMPDIPGAVPAVPVGFLDHVPNLWAAKNLARLKHRKRHPELHPGERPQLVCRACAGPQIPHGKRACAAAMCLLTMGRRPTPLGPKRRRGSRATGDAGAASLTAGFWSMWRQADQAHGGLPQIQFPRATRPWTMNLIGTKTTEPSHRLQPCRSVVFVSCQYCPCLSMPKGHSATSKQEGGRGQGKGP